MATDTLYTQVFISQDGVVRVVYTEGFGWLMGEEEQSEVLGDQEAVVAGQNDVRVETEVVVASSAPRVTTTCAPAGGPGRMYVVLLTTVGTSNVWWAWLERFRTSPGRRGDYSAWLNAELVTDFGDDVAALTEPSLPRAPSGFDELTVDRAT